MKEKVPASKKGVSRKESCPRGAWERTRSQRGKEGGQKSEGVKEYLPGIVPGLRFK